MVHAGRTGSLVRGLRWDEPISGAEYRRGLLLIGEDVAELCDRYLVPGRNREVWWDIARLFAHEVAHGIAPRSNNALEEAVAETLGRRDAGEVLGRLEGAPAPPTPGHWEAAGMYRAQVVWLDALAAWLGFGRVEVAAHLKDGRAHRRVSAAERQELLLGRLIEHRLLGQQVMCRDEATLLGAEVAESAGSVNVPGRHRTGPRSPVAAVRRFMRERG